MILSNVIVKRHLCDKAIRFVAAHLRRRLGYAPGGHTLWQYFYFISNEMMRLNILALKYRDSGKLSTDVPDVDTGIDWLVYFAQYSQQCQVQSHFVVRSRLDIVENTEIMSGHNQAFIAVLFDRTVVHLGPEYSAAVPHRSTARRLTKNISMTRRYLWR